MNRLVASSSAVLAVVITTFMVASSFGQNVELGRVMITVRGTVDGP